MFRIFGALILGLILTGCEVFLTEEDLANRRIGLTATPCEGNASENCFFINAPVRLGGEPVRIASRSNNFFHTAEPLEFTDSGKRQWMAPVQTLTDGASIPPIFIPIVGDPKSQEFINAATIHDAYCGIGNEDGPEYHAAKWEDVHRMFYNALRVGGTPELKAKIMFAAVYIGGPRWHDAERDLSDVPDNLLVAELESTIEYIEKENPPLYLLIRFMRQREAALPLREHAKAGDETPAFGVSYPGLGVPGSGGAGYPSIPGLP